MSQRRTFDRPFQRTTRSQIRRAQRVALLKYLATKKGYLTLDALCEELGVTASQVYRVVHGVVPSRTLRARIVEALGPEAADAIADDPHYHDHPSRAKAA